MSVHEVLSLVWNDHFSLHRHFDEAVEVFQAAGWRGQGVYLHWGGLTRTLLVLGCAPDRLQARLQLQRAGRLFAAKRAVHLRDECRITAALLKHDGFASVPGFFTLCDLPDFRLGETWYHGSAVQAKASSVLHSRAMMRELDPTNLAVYQRIMRGLRGIEGDHSDDEAEEGDEEAEESEEEAEEGDEDGEP